MDASADFDPDLTAEVERLRLEWLAMVGPSRVAQRADRTRAEIWWAWTRWQVAKSRLEARAAALAVNPQAASPRPPMAPTHVRGPMDLTGFREP